MPQQHATSSMYRLHGLNEGLDVSVAVPAYPKASRSQRQRRRKRNKKKSKRQWTTGSSSDDGHKVNNGSKKSTRKKNGAPLPMPHLVTTLHQEEEEEQQQGEQPQVLLWHSNMNSTNLSSWSLRRGSGSSDDKEEERNTSSSDIFRHQTVRRQGPSSDVEQAEKCISPIDILAPQAKWYEWDYWKDRLFDRRCCLPNARGRASMKRREPLIDYRPSYLGRYDDDNLVSSFQPSSPWGVPQRQQQHYYIMPWPPPQVSPLTEAGTSFAFSPTHQGKVSPPQQRLLPGTSAPADSFSPAVPRQVRLLQDDLISPIEAHRKATTSSSKAGRRKRHHRKSSSLLGTHYELPEADLVGVEDEKLPTVDAQSVSSLESANIMNDNSNNNCKTPMQQQLKLIIPDSNKTEGTTPSNNSTMSNRIMGLRRTQSRTASPRPASKPPVPPPRRQSLGTRHKSQVTNSTMASTALPPLPSPPMPPSPMSIPIPAGGRDLARSFSEASANTNGSRHRRGGTVCEFSFESSLNTKEQPRSKPPPSSIRSTSLPVEVQIQVHVPVKSPEQQPPPIRMVDSKDSWGVTPPKSYSQDAHGETPEGYISPLEEEHFTLLTASPGDRTSTSTSPREIVSTTSEAEAYAADVDSPQTSSNPQDSLCGDDSRGDEENDPHRINFEQTSPFAKLKGPPSIPAGESWMLSWVNKENNRNTLKTPATQTEAKAVTPTQSPSSTGSGSSAVVEKQKLHFKTEYFPKNLALDKSWRNKHAPTPLETIVFSGWVAFGRGNAIVGKVLSGTNLEHGDVAYVVLANGSEKLWFSQLELDGTFDSISLNACRVEVHEISREYGRAIYLKRNACGETVVCTLLPVCLPEHYNGNKSEFGDGSLCFPTGDYLPDDQQYTTMHIMFALDALLKAKQSFMY